MATTATAMAREIGISESDIASVEAQVKKTVSSGVELFRVDRCVVQSTSQTFFSGGKSLGIVLCVSCDVCAARSR